MTAQSSKTRSQVKSVIESKKFTRFDNIWDHKDICASPNIRSHLDANFLNVSVVSRTHTKHYVYAAIDPATNKFVFAKTFLSKNNKRSLKAPQSVKVLKNGLAKKNIQKPIIINTLIKVFI